MENVTLKVEGMSCGSCVNKIEGSVSELAGVNQVNVKLADGQVEVSFNESQVSLDAIKEAIENRGYDVE